VSETDLQHRLEETSREVERLRAENERLRTLLALAQHTQAVLAPTTHAPLAAAPLSASEKVALVRRVFRGREDVYAVRWENARTGRSGYDPAVAGGWSRNGANAYLPLSDEAIERHLRGHESIGVYPLLTDDSCWFLACDLDGGTWQLDALALLDACGELGVPAALERSRSGSGAHIWVFFAEAVAASAARRLGAVLLREAMSRRAELDLTSYDRLFPSQDFLPAKGFGNLIALPLQGRCRAGDTSVFLDPARLEPWPDQWAFLSSLERVLRDQVERLLDAHEDVAFGAQALSARRVARRDEHLPVKVNSTIGAGIAIARAELPPSLLAELKHLASLHNPLFYERQRLRLSTHQTPRLIRCYDEDLTHLCLPRGLLAQVGEAVAEAGSRLVVDDRRPVHPHLPLEFHGELTPLQQGAVAAMLAHDDGVLVAPPGTGKTVIACALIAARKQPTLVLAHSKPLLEQWRSQLQALLGLPSKQIGQLGGGRRKRTGIVDLAMIQSLKTADDLEALFSDYGLVVVDECHHLPAVSFETAVRRAPVRHFLGLTATPYRRDGLQEIVTMQCGPIRHRIAQSGGPAGEIELELAVREPMPPERRSTRCSGCSSKTNSAPPSSATTCSPRSPKAGAASSSVSGSSTAGCSRRRSAAAASRRSCSRVASVSAPAPRCWNDSRARRAARTSSSSPQANTSAKASTARNLTPSSSPSPSRSGAASFSTPAASCAPTRGRPTCASTTTRTFASRCCAPCTRAVCERTSRSASHCATGKQSPLRSPPELLPEQQAYAEQHPTVAP
jgi:hypothetical protein